MTIERLTLYDTDPSAALAAFEAMTPAARHRFMERMEERYSIALGEGLDGERLTLPALDEDPLYQLCRDWQREQWREHWPVAAHPLEPEDLPF